MRALFPLDSKEKSLPLLLISLLGAFILATMPLPHIVGWFRPDWVLLVLLFWLITLPDYLGLVFAWVVGLIMDLLTGNFLGQQALAYVVISFFAISLHQQFRMFARTQQALIVSLAIAIAALIDGIVAQVFGQAEFSLLLFLPVLSSAACWPLIGTLLQRAGRK